MDLGKFDLSGEDLEERSVPLNSEADGLDSLYPDDTWVSMVREPGFLDSAVLIHMPKIKLKW